MTKAITRQDLALLKSSIGSVVNESLLKKLQEINRASYYIRDI